MLKYSHIEKHKGDFMEQLNYDLIKEKVSKNPKVKEILSLSAEQIATRYFTKQPSEFKQSFINSCNAKDENGRHINISMITLQGKNLDYIAQKLLTLSKRLALYGYYLNTNAIVNDYEKMFVDFESDIDNLTAQDKKFGEVRWYVMLVCSEFMAKLDEAKNYVRSCKTETTVVSDSNTTLNP